MKVLSALLLRFPLLFSLPISQVLLIREFALLQYLTEAGGEEALFFHRPSSPQLVLCFLLWRVVW